MRINSQYHSETTIFKKISLSIEYLELIYSNLIHLIPTFACLLELYPDREANMLSLLQTVMLTVVWMRAPSMRPETTMDMVRSSERPVPGRDEQ